jgi:predicted nuclease with TOPRIM domain
MSKFLLVLLLGGAGLFYWYYNDTQARLTELVENNAKLQIAVQTSEAALKSVQEDLKRANEETQKVNAEFQQIRAQNNVLAGKLQKHDLGVLGAAKPALVEKIINKASAKAGRCFELLSGAELTEEEKNATSEKAFNSECPWLWTSRVQPVEQSSSTKN